MSGWRVWPLTTPLFTLLEMNKEHTRFFRRSSFERLLDGVRSVRFPFDFQPVGLIVTASAAISFSRLVGYYRDEYIQRAAVTMAKW